MKAARGRVWGGGWDTGPDGASKLQPWAHRLQVATVLSRRSGALRRQSWKLWAHIGGVNERVGVAEPPEALARVPSLLGSFSTSTV